MTSIAIAQVGVNTRTPEGMLDLQNTDSFGVIFPKFMLTSTAVELPVKNPQGGSLAVGTTVYNQNTTNNGSFDVTPGIYAWDGTKWIPQFLREDSKIYEQTPLTQRITNSGGYVDVNGIGTGTTFTAAFTGVYRIKANFNFAAGKILLPANGDVSMATQEGYFKFTFEGTDHLIYTHAYSMYNDDVGGSGTYYDQFRHDSSLVLYETLTKGDTYDFSLQIDMFVSNSFENGGNSGDGRAFVGLEIPCTVEFTYLGDEN